ncbi:hypothetical protein GQ42DRAFT_17259 [Ramicandelaber brevisporus]|nr:hypothetical protein GQ42DRAFT_17259 [Ramicandelaber brevisporus]
MLHRDCQRWHGRAYNQRTSSSCTSNQPRPIHNHDVRGVLHANEETPRRSVLYPVICAIPTCVSTSAFSFSFFFPCFCPITFSHRISTHKRYKSVRNRHFPHSYLTYLYSISNLICHIPLNQQPVSKLSFLRTTNQPNTLTSKTSLTTLLRTRTN